MAQMFCHLATTLALSLLTTTISHAADVDVEAFGCRADGPTCTDGFNAAVANVSASGGGTVHACGPGAYTVAGVELRSHVVLVVHQGATVNASRTLADWRPRKLVQPACAPPDGGTGVLGGLFYASLATNVTIRGPGAVNGAAKEWNGYFGTGADVHTPVGPGTDTIRPTGPPPQPNPLGLSRSNMFVFSQCADVVVEDLRIEDSSAWTLNPRYSNRLSFRRLRITAPALGSKGHNTDGFDPWACSDAEFADSYYSGGDDCVAIKSGADASASAPWPCGLDYVARNISVNNITCDGSHGLTIGSEMSGGVDGVAITNVHIFNSGPSVRIKSLCGRRGFVRNVLYENISGTGVAQAVWIDMQYDSTATSCDSHLVPRFDNITIRNLAVDEVTSSAFEVVGLAVTGGNGSDPLVVHGVTLDNVSVRRYPKVGECVWADVDARHVSPPFPACARPPTPAPPATCTVGARIGCFNDSAHIGLGLAPQTQTHDKNTLEVCAAACFAAKLSDAAIDAGNHCFCGDGGTVARLAGHVRPLSECEQTPCHADPSEKCGGIGRMLVYNYSCVGW